MNTPAPAAPAAPAQAKPAVPPAAPVVQVAKAPTATPTNALTLEQFEKEVSAFGSAFGQGQNSRPSMAIRAVEAAQKVTSITPDLAETLWTKFQQAAAKKKGLEYKQEGSFKVQVSKFRQFLAMGCLPSIDSLDVIYRGADMIKSLANQSDSPLKGSAYDHLVNIARAQITSPEKALTDNQIKDILVPEDPEAKSDLDKLIDTYKKVCKALNLKFGKVQGDVAVAIQDAVENLQIAIHKAGGKVPSVEPIGPVEEEDKKAEAAKKAAQAAQAKAKQ
jgi:hypothetical protein